MGLFSKVSTYNDKLEKILESKNYDSETKNLLLNMLYKIEISFADYQKVKGKGFTKEEFIEKIIDIIDKKCEDIKTVTPRTEKSKALESEGVNSIVDEKMGTILVYANEKDLLYAICEMDIKYILYANKNAYFIKNDELQNDAIMKFVLTGAAMDVSEIIRDFNGWSWNANIKDMENINYNLLYQNIAILQHSPIKSEFMEYNEIIEKVFCLECDNEKLFSKIKNLALAVLAMQDEDVKKSLKAVEKQRKKQLDIMSDNKAFLEDVTKNKKELNRKIKEIDEMLNDKERMKKEYDERNSKLANKDKIFSISHLANMLEEEREECLKEIQKYNKLMEPLNYVQEKELVGKKYEEIRNILNATEKDAFEREIIEIQKEFLKTFLKDVENAETNQEILELIYKLRYYCLLPINEIQAIKDVPELKESIKEVINALVDKGIDKKVLENISDSISLCYNTFKYIFECKIIDLEKVNIKIVKNKEEDKIADISIILYDSKDADEIHREKVNNLHQLNIKQNKKIAIILK